MLKLVKKKVQKLILGGERATDGNLAKGYFFQPTIFIDVNKRYASFQRRNFWSYPFSC
jgi:acyl-CoA reductase-like NAD-dependent aldehyde dehydrogenase